MEAWGLHCPRPSGDLVWTGRRLQGEQGAGESWSCLPLVLWGQAPYWLLTGCPEGRVDPPLTGLAPRPQQLPDEVKRGHWCTDSRGVPAAWGSRPPEQRCPWL